MKPSDEPSEGIASAIRRLAKRRGLAVIEDDERLELLAACGLPASLPEPLLDAVAHLLGFFVELEDAPPGEESAGCARSELPPAAPPGRHSGPHDSTAPRPDPR